MIVDDEPVNIKVVRKYLADAGYENFLMTSESHKAAALVRSQVPDLVLLDLMMPQVTGLDILEDLRGDDQMPPMPIIVLTAETSAEMKLAALRLGVSDFLNKPVDPSELVLRVRNNLLVKAHQDQLASYSARLEREVRVRTAELAISRREAIQCLGRAAEYRDQQTGDHVIRVGKYAALIAEQLGIDDEAAALIGLAAQLHDVGKIGVPDRILRKPGRLSTEEFAAMKRHCTFGLEIIGGVQLVSGLEAHVSDDVYACSSPIMRLAATIAYTHHEKWDGTGYPNGLAGEEIPIEGRITAVADVFDALSCRRPYKAPFGLDECLAMMQRQRGYHFDPNALDAFLSRRQEVENIYTTYADRL